MPRVRNVKEIMKMSLVFVYGALRKGQPLHGVLSKSEQRGTCFTEPHFTMFDLGQFPGIIPRGKTKIFGEVYLICPNTLEEIDRIEGCPEFYVRNEVNTPMGVAHAYFLHPDYIEECMDDADHVDGKIPTVPHGNWVNWLKFQDDPPF